VDQDSYLLALCRYIVRNPVAAHMVSQAADWPWSSYLATMGLAPKAEWLHTDWVLSQFGTSQSQSRKHYEQFIADGEGFPPIWESLSQQIYLGNDESDIPHPQCLTFLFKKTALNHFCKVL